MGTRGVGALPLRTQQVAGRGSGLRTPTSTLHSASTCQVPQRLRDSCPRNGGQAGVFLRGRGHGGGGRCRAGPGEHEGFVWRLCRPYGGRSCGAVAVGKRAQAEGTAFLKAQRWGPSVSGPSSPQGTSRSELGVWRDGPSRSWQSGLSSPGSYWKPSCFCPPLTPIGNHSLLADGDTRHREDRGCLYSRLWRDMARTGLWVP